MYASVSSSSWSISSSQNTGARSACVIGLSVAGFKSGAGLFFISARTLYHFVGISLSSRYILYGILFSATKMTSLE